MLMTHANIPDHVIDVPSTGVAFWQTKGWATASAGVVVTPVTKVAPSKVTRVITHPSLPGRTAVIPFAVVPAIWANLGWV